MAFLDTLKNRAEEAKRLATEALEKNLATEEVRTQRLETCETCEHYFKITKQCKKCGCFLPAKTKLKGQKCPINKW